MTPEFFHYADKARTRFIRQCKACKSEYDRQYREKNAEHLAEIGAKYREAHREEARERARKWHRENPERAAEANKNWAKANPERVKQIKRRYTEAHLEEIREKNRNWSRENREKVNARQRRYQERKKQAGGAFAPEHVAIKYELQQGKCFYCGKDLGDEYHTDHRIPLFRGGSNWPQNIVVACPLCNQKKATSMPEDFIARLKEDAG
jgi:5-methylcytosine-specific restriction endonuclease McrA